MQWFENNCDGEWEHYNQVQIYTLDNPGWGLKIDLLDTDVEGKEFETIQEYTNEKEWIVCSKKEGLFKGGGDSKKLEEIIKIFKDWVES
ncbi:hypothetical protein M2145_002973 [Lachnospiraceae bacterium PF1-21]|uniref:Immunity 53 family protein n=1 Tax=Ohessyouella blattaphilus TaxID=2949333 RepID=A0ABT1ELL0_9FIRM|nr:immunity 53 family protein [Ohessyouella blattaphilus]MCP1111568.1 immunity 53 family protein [Ohessyouella blattaphilus]MCR8564962.1 immunity 53 family protein [Ohessyouella blattaphilus]